MSDNIIRSSFDKSYVSKSIKDDTKELEEIKEEKPVVDYSKNTETTKKKVAPKKTSTNSSKTTKKEEPSEVALYSEGKIAHPALGRLAKGYNIVDPETAKEWMNISNRVRLATPEEVAIAYEV